MPTVWLCATIALAAVSLWKPPADLGIVYLKTLVLWPSGPWIDGVYWTLVVEVIFYGLVFAIIKINRGLLPRALQAVGLISTAYWLFRYATVGFPSLWIEGLLPRFLLLEHGCFFALGSLLWRAQQQRSGLADIAILGAAGFGSVIQTWFWCGLIGYSSPIVPVVIFCAGVATVWFSPKLSFPKDQAGGARLIGLTTYPLYLLHATVGIALQTVLLKWLDPLVALVLALGAVLILSGTIAALIEPRLQRRLRAALGSRGALNPLAGTR